MAPHHQETRQLGPDLPRRLGPVGLLFVAAGSLQVATACGDRGRVAAGDLLVVRSGPGVELMRPDPGLRGVILRIDPDWASHAFGATPQRAGFAEVCLEPAGSELADRARVALSGAALRAADAEALEVAAQRIECLRIASAAHRGLSAPRSRPAAGNNQENALIHVLRALENEDPATWSVAKVAERLGLSVRQTSRLARRQLGLSLREHLTQLRLARARAALEEGQDSILEVALDTGWSSPSHFNEVFRRRIGVTPSAYRAEHRRPMPGRAEEAPRFSTG